MLTIPTGKAAMTCLQADTMHTLRPVSRQRSHGDLQPGKMPTQYPIPIGKTAMAGTHTDKPSTLMVSYDVSHSKTHWRSVSKASRHSIILLRRSLGSPHTATIIATETRATATARHNNINPCAKALGRV